MKQLTEYNRVSGYLNKIFNLLNGKYFENALSKPVITIQSTPKAYGHVTIYHTWLSDEEHRRELNIGAGTLNRPIEETVATMLHEMVHLYNLERGVQDCSRGGTYHNKQFKIEAEKRDLIIDHHPAYGWTITHPSDNLIQFCIDNELVEIKVTRLEAITTPPSGTPKGGSGTMVPPTITPPKTSSTRKHLCPRCNNTVRTTKTLSVICGDCYKATGEIHFMECAI